MLAAEVVEATVNPYYSIADMVGAEPNTHLENTTALDRTDDVLNPNTAPQNHTIVGFLRIV